MYLWLFRGVFFLDGVIASAVVDGWLIRSKDCYTNLLYRVLAFEHCRSITSTGPLHRCSTLPLWITLCTRMVIFWKTIKNIIRLLYPQIWDCGLFCYLITLLWRTCLVSLRNSNFLKCEQSVFYLAFWRTNNFNLISMTHTHTLLYISCQSMSV